MWFNNDEFYELKKLHQSIVRSVMIRFDLYDIFKVAEYLSIESTRIKMVLSGQCILTDEDIMRICNLMGNDYIKDAMPSKHINTQAHFKSAG